MEFEKRLASVRPSKRQFEFQKTEFYAFVHFTVNTYTDREWGDGSESPQIFYPKSLDARQWAKAVKSAGMKGLILTCKHHDGFCLWPSKYTAHTIAASPYKDGKGDIVSEASAACKEYGLKFGIYLSPWDRHEPSYGTGKAYDDYFVSQLTELLTGYGDIFCVWLDGACGEGKNGKKQYYDWERYYEVVRRYQPGACINVCGPDIRWCGNEAGQTRPSEWSVVPEEMRDTEKIASLSQKRDEEGFRVRMLSAAELDLGSREKLRAEKNLIWYPAEVNTSIRPGWFYHQREDEQVKTPDALFDIYCSSVGGNATLLLNIPPAKDGLFHENDVACLEELGEKIRALTENDITKDVRIREDEITVFLKEKTAVGCIILQEDISKGQRVESFSVFADGVHIYDGTVIGYKKIIRLQDVVADSLQIKITASRMEP
ncbi:MAG: alpha-L-fucosidase, partial [Lachnospiraceae bacterium]|nr:alpha-L-fucosidase [Lachnospiraceae bacterium]